MAGNQVTLTFAGDSSQLERSMDRIGSSARDMDTSVGSAAGGIDRVGESADGAETRFTGLASGIDGVTTLMQDPSPQEFAQGLADMADGVANFVVPTLKTLGTQILATGRAAITSAAQHVAAAARTVAGWVLMGVQATVNAVKIAAAWLISLGPVGLVIAAVAAVIAILVSLGVGFDDLKRWAQVAWEFILGVIQGVWQWVADNWPLLLGILTGPIGWAVLLITSHWETIKNGFTAVKDWIGARVSDVVSFFTGLPGRLASAAGDMWGFIRSTFKNAINWVIEKWNNFSISWGGFDPPGPGSIPGFTINTPNIPYLAEGGIVRRPTLAVIGEAGPEAVVPLDRLGSSAGSRTVTVNVYVQGSIRSDRELVGVIRTAIDQGVLVP